MRDLRSARMMWLKAILFLLIGITSGTLIVTDSPHLKTGLLLALCVWAFCRAYYFAFYVLEKYADPSFRYAGLGSLLYHLMRPKRNR